jgi:sodium transport system permease protein
MLNQSIIIARKEILDHLREVRSLWASLLHVLMGPVVVSLVLFAMKNTPPDKLAAVLTGMTSIFVMVSAFVGGMNVSMDLLAGERERRSLLPLLLNPVPKSSVVVGKWLAISMFAALGVLLSLGAFAVAFRIAGVQLTLFSPQNLLFWGALGLLPLAGFAAALQLTISTFCRTAKEAQTYLSLLVFGPMGVAMFLVFLAPKPAPWMFFVPIAGHQALLLAGPQLPFVTLLLLLATAFCTALALCFTASLLHRDEIVYGS